MEMRSFMLPVIFLLVQEFVCEGEAAATSSRSPANPPDKEEWKDPKSGNHPSTTSRSTTTKSGSGAKFTHSLGSRVAGGHMERELHKDRHKTYMIEADKVTMDNGYEQSINPFLFHLEQSWRLKPLRHHRYLKKKMFQQQHHPLQHDHEEHPVGGNKHQSSTEAVNTVDELPENPNRPHFIDSDEDNGDEGRAFGDEEKDLRDLFQVLFSPDY